MKGSLSNYRPNVGEKCLISPPHSDDENGYVFQEYEVYWKNDIFVLYGNKGCYPNLNKWEHVIAKQLEQEKLKSDKKTLRYSKESLFHFSCDNCKGWWTIGDWEKSEALYCPYCSYKYEVFEEMKQFKGE